MEVKTSMADTAQDAVKGDHCPSAAAGGGAHHHAGDHDFVMVHGDSDCSRDQASTRHPAKRLQLAQE